MKLKLSVTLLALMALAGCATPTVVSRVKPTDNQLSCAQLQNELTEAQNYHDAAQKETGVTGGNVARFIFFWPAIIGTSMNASEAKEAANARMNNISSLMNQKSCPANLTATPAVTALPGKTSAN